MRQSQSSPRSTLRLASHFGGWYWGCAQMNCRTLNSTEHYFTSRDRLECRKNAVFTRSRSFRSDGEGTDKPYGPISTRERYPRLAAFGIGIRPDGRIRRFSLVRIRNQSFAGLAAPGDRPHVAPADRRKEAQKMPGCGSNTSQSSRQRRRWTDPSQWSLQPGKSRLNSCLPTGTRTSPRPGGRERGS